MEPSELYDTPAALRSQVRHYRAHSEKQAAKIVGLEGKIVDLESKVAYLQEALAQERLGVPSHAAAQLTGEHAASLLSANQKAESPSKPPQIADIARPYTPASSQTGSAEDPFVIEDEDGEIPGPSVVDSSPTQKRKILLSPANLADIGSSRWPPFESPRKKPKVWVEIPRIAKRGSTARATAAPLEGPSREEDLGERPDIELPDPRERSVSPMSDLTTPPGSPAAVEASLENDGSPPSPSPVDVEFEQQQRSFSRELSYADVPPSVPSNGETTSSGSQTVSDGTVAEVEPPSANEAQVSSAYTPVDRSERTHEPPSVPRPSSPRPTSSAPTMAQPGVRPAVTSASSSSGSKSAPGTSSTALAPAPAASFSRAAVPAPAQNHPAAPRIKDRLDPLPPFPVAALSAPLLHLRVSRKDLHAGAWKVPTFALCEHRELLGARRDFLFPTLAMNPLLPPRAGRAGLLYRANDRCRWEDGVQTVFVQRRSAEYEYVGEYELTRAPSLSTAEFRTWPVALKNSWAKSISNKAKFSDLCARIVLRSGRHDGREPTAAEIKEEVARRKRWKKSAKSAGGERAPVAAYKDLEKKIVKAYEDGVEVMGVWNMVCVGFHEHLLEQVHRDIVAQKNAPAE